MKVDLSLFIQSDDAVFSSVGIVEHLCNDADNALKIVFPVTYRLNVYKVEKELVMRLEADYVYKTECARCLADITPSYSAYLELDLISGKVGDDYENDYVQLIDNSIDLDECLYSLIETSMPHKDLCSDDCKGVCPRCGTDLNTGTCDCQEQEVDPRMADLLKLFSNDGEVL